MFVTPFLCTQVFLVKAMMKSNLIKLYFCLLSCGLFSGVSNATVIDYSDVNSLSTFQDTSTGRVWLDMDNFFDETATVGTSGFDMIAIASDAGFTFATRTDVEELLNTLGQYTGKKSDRDLFIETIRERIRAKGSDYLTVIKSLEAQDADIGTRWLQGIVDHVTHRSLEVIPSFGDVEE